MTNAASSKKHGLSKIKILRAKSKLRNRRNKDKARQRKLERRNIINA